MKKLILTIFIALALLKANAQEYAITDIPDSLLIDANAVVRLDEVFFKQNDINSATSKYTFVITILNEKGVDDAYILIPQDRLRELKSFSGIVQDPKTGKTIKKISKSDLYTTAYSPGMISDDKISLYHYEPSSYPFTLKYEYEIKHKNGICAYPTFIPISGYNIATQKAKYTIQLPTDMKIRYKALQYPNYKPNVIQQGEYTAYEWVVENLCAIDNEPYAPPLNAIAPAIMIAPQSFCMEGNCGNMTDWKSLGAWFAKLQEGRTDIPQQLKDKLLELVKDAPTDREKIRLIYKYLQNNTRYVSIQFGIGGFQPLTAESVAKSGFGDCKALTNYMRSMLDAIGIPSIYTVISTDRKNIYTDYASLNQMNHVILAVPQPSDTIWLECTSSEMPFNYTHSDIAGHQALLVTPNGGEICRVRPLPEVGDNTSSNFTIEVMENGNGKAMVKKDYKLEAYEKMLNFLYNMSRPEQINYLASNSNLSKVKIADLDIKPNHSELPDLQLNYAMDIERYANKSGNRLFVPFSPIELKIGSLLKQSKRKYDIVIGAGMVQTDTLEISIPNGYEPETIPKPASIESVFGNYSLKTAVNNNNTLQVIQQIYLKQGRYPASEYENFRLFLKQIGKESSKRAVYKSKT